MESVKYIVVHCSATPANRDIGVEAIRKMHKLRGFLDVGYHYVIRRNGATEKGRPDDRPGAHARGFNQHSLSICLVGGVTQDLDAEDNFNERQYETLEKLLRELKATYPDALILGHRDLPRVNKACPCFDVEEWWNNLNQPEENPQCLTK